MYQYEGGDELYWFRTASQGNRLLESPTDHGGNGGKIAHKRIFAQFYPRRIVFWM
jgi:hypothetical protein